MRPRIVCPALLWAVGRTTPLRLMPALWCTLPSLGSLRRRVRECDSTSRGRRPHRCPNMAPMQIIPRDASSHDKVPGITDRDL